MSTAPCASPAEDDEGRERLLRCCARPPFALDRIEELSERTFGFDALRCTTCKARMRIVATINDPVVAKKILAHVGVSTEPLSRARARDPTGQMDFGDYAA